MSKQRKITSPCTIQTVNTNTTKNSPRATRLPFFKYDSTDDHCNSVASSVSSQCQVGAPSFHPLHHFLNGYSKRGHFGSEISIQFQITDQSLSSTLIHTRRHTPLSHSLKLIFTLYLQTPRRTHSNAICSNTG